MLESALGRARRTATRQRRRWDWRKARLLNRRDDKSKDWHKSGESRWPLSLAIAGDLILVAWVTLKLLDASIVSVLDAVSIAVVPVLLVAPSYTLFVVWRWRRVNRWYLERAREHPELLVPTSGSILGEVIGRDQLCRVLIENVRNRDTRRPNLLVGGVGTGKTAVLVEMTRLLATHKAFPIAIRLRDAVEGLDFEQMAFLRFKAELDQRLLVDASADQLWRQLRRENRVVVLADGLDEALPDPKKCEDRETAIRLAIRTASERQLPLIVASRPHDPLRGVEGALCELEPLGEGPALDYLTEGTKDTERRTLTRLVQTADISAAPLYLQLLHEMVLVRRRQGPEGGRDWLSSIAGDHRDGVDAERVDADRIEIRLRLLDEWRRLLVQGYLYEDYALNERLRRRTIDVLSALACIGLSNDTAEVDFTALTGTSCDADGTSKPLLPQCAAIASELKDRLAEESGIAVSVDESLCTMAATMGCELGIVEARERSVRFRHSLIQAYLGSAFLGGALDDSQYVKRALEKSGHEFFIALVMHSRRSAVRDEPNRQAGASARSRARIRSDDWWTRLRETARTHPNRVKQLQMYAAILEIDSYQSLRPYVHRETLCELLTRWGEFQTGDVQDQALLDARIELVRQIGRAARRIWAAPKDGDLPATALNYPAYFDIGVADDDESVRLLVAREIGEGGYAAYHSLQATFDEWWRWWEGRWRSDCETWAAAEGGKKEFRTGVLCAQLAPLLLQPPSDSVAAGRPRSDDDEWSASSVENLKRWLRDFLPAVDTRCHEKRPWISMEIALAQGFKLAGNRRPLIAEPQHRRAALVECAEEALKYSRFWFAQLTLIQALTLCSLPADPDAPPAAGGHDGHDGHGGHGADPRAHVAHWMRIAGSGFGEAARARAPHPLVREAGELAMNALISRRPHLFCWIDETETVGQVGSVSPPDHPLHEFRQWILPSTGWSVLHPRALRLLGDVVLLMSLSNRGATPTEREERLLRSDKQVLPPCLTRDRTSLDVTRTVGSAEISDPGSNCHDDCDFGLCPYPPVGERRYREELGEGFCRALRQSGEKPGYATQLSRREYSEFWDEMSQRVRPRRDRPGLRPLDDERDPVSRHSRHR